jgi:hypothetical protein
MVDLDSLEYKAEPKANSDSKAKLDDALERFLDGARALVEQQNASLTPPRPVRPDTPVPGLGNQHRRRSAIYLALESEFSNLKSNWP